ncbi:hypothetical protein CNMCM8980_002223 [Aspergillus fumigatiaffinis]|uniref:Uncharacterized protein n=1 Tax=Aspergillus fumigatiaffinis TaxID=340414 RepID=A0A8H4GSR1_9EURO|nr:hypothetical protein CNMCM5878_002669 [Aspergillus fumigatiaffinis]KAF4220154.1 hypothetical protein CNMCM6457_002566 [Aspergillus fumigatiaffinis]KAF4227668.1 hypothetical protein CNMCM6805_002763 [Aspergillus fumigatiaffinis]KAF4237991.1 hypothetical protein CNMCM8980_002223 [Aspergillus fumigatiaffinis]
MAQKKRVRQTTTALFTQLPTNGRIPFKQVLQATWVAVFALFIGICFVLAIAFSADGKPTSSNKWYEYTPTFVALGAVVLRGSVAALLGIVLYQNLWQNVAAPAKANKEPRVETGGEGGIPLKRVESLHLASRLAVGMLAYPLFRAGWIIGFLGLAVTSAVQPVLQSAITVRQERQVIPMDLPIYHPQFNGSLALSDSAAMFASGPTTISRRSAVAALMGEKSGLRYTDANVTGIASFGPVKYLDVTCNIEAVPGNKSNLGGWDLYNFTYRYPDAEQQVSDDPRFDLTKFRDVFNISVLYDGVEISVDAKSKVEVQAVMFNNTHYLRHLCMVQTAIGSCATPITAGIGSMGDLACLRDQFINVDSDLDKAGSFYGPAGGVMSLFGSFLQVFTGKALLNVRGRLNPGKSLFMMGTMVADTDKTLVMPSDLLSHMQRVLWVTPLLAKFGTPEQEALNVTMSVLDERNVIVYKIDKPRIIATVAVLLIIGLGCLVYLSLCSSGACGRLTRDSLVHSLTVAGPNGPAIKGACLASLEEILDKAGDEKLKFGVLLAATDSLALAEISVLRVDVQSEGRYDEGRPVLSKDITYRYPQPIASFSTHFAVANKQIGSQKGQSQGNHSQNPEIPSFSLDSLGLSKTTKTVVLVILGVFGTIESWFWVQTVWRWWKSDDEGTN